MHGVRCWLCCALHPRMISNSPVSRLIGNVTARTLLQGLIIFSIPRTLFRFSSKLLRSFNSSTSLSSTIPAARSKNSSTISKKLGSSPSVSESADMDRHWLTSAWLPRETDEPFCKMFCEFLLAWMALLARALNMMARAWHLSLSKLLSSRRPLVKQVPTGLSQRKQAADNKRPLDKNHLDLPSEVWRSRDQIWPIT